MAVCLCVSHTFQLGECGRQKWEDSYQPCSCVWCCQKLTGALACHTAHADGAAAAAALAAGKLYKLSSWGSVGHEMSLRQQRATLPPAGIAAHLLAEPPQLVSIVFPLEGDCLQHYTQHISSKSEGWPSGVWTQSAATRLLRQWRGMLGSLHTQSVECRIVLIITQCWWSFPQLSHNRRWRFRHKRVFTFKCSGHNRRCTQYFGRSDNNISQPTACGSKTTA